MRRSVDLSDPAQAEWAAARRWLTQAGAGERAKRRRLRITAAIRDLGRHPCRWSFGDHHAVRERAVEGYRILYEVHPDTGDDRTAGDVVLLRIFGPYQDRSEI